MVRPTKWRKVENIPTIPYFVPTDKDVDEIPENILKLEELEAIRLKDLADAVIVPGPVDQYQTATLIPGFIEEKDLPEVIRQAWPYEWTRDWTVKSANDTLARWCELEKETLIRMKSEE
mgnify:CR=1 FL=1